MCASSHRIWNEKIGPYVSRSCCCCCFWCRADNWISLVPFIRSFFFLFAAAIYFVQVFCVSLSLSLSLCYCVMRVQVRTRKCSSSYVIILVYKLDRQRYTTMHSIVVFLQNRIHISGFHATFQVLARVFDESKLSSISFFVRASSPSLLLLLLLVWLVAGGWLLQLCLSVCHAMRDVCVCVYVTISIYINLIVL